MVEWFEANDTIAIRGEFALAPTHLSYLDIAEFPKPLDCRIHLLPG